MTPRKATKTNGGSTMEPQYRLIKYKLLDPPVVAMRVRMDDAKLESLAASIRASGLIYPICVVAEGGRYRICSGHRRYVAIGALGWDEVPCKDYTRTGIDPRKIKGHENLHREDPNDGELVQWLREEQESQPMTLDELREMTGESEHWINTRMAIVRGDKEVFLALVNGEINLSQATVLNKFPDDYRHTYIETVKASTPPARLIEGWLRDVKLLLSHQQPGEAMPPPVPVEAMPGIAPVQACSLCKEAHSPWTYVTVTCHKGCIDSVVNQIHGGGG